MNEIAPPIPAPDPYADARIFRMRFIPCFIGTIIGSLSWSLPVCIIILIPIKHFASTFSALIIFCIGVCALLAAIQIQLFPVIVDAWGLRGTNFWGKSMLITWSNEIYIKHTLLFFLPYLKISTSQKKNLIWLPLFLSDMQGFREAVEKFAPLDNPLRHALAQRQ